MPDLDFELLRFNLIELRSAYVALDERRLLRAAKDVGRQLEYESLDLSFVTDIDPDEVEDLRAELREAQSELLEAEHNPLDEIDDLNDEIDRLTKELDALKGVTSSA